MAIIRDGTLVIRLAAEMGWKLSDAEEAALASLQWLSFEGSLRDMDEREFRDLVDFALRSAASPS